MSLPSRCYLRRMGAALITGGVLIGGGLLRASDVDLLIPAGGEPRTLAVTIEVDGRPFAAVWDEAMGSLTAFADADGGGDLDQQEAARLPSVLAMEEVVGLGFTPDLGSPPDWSSLDANGDGRATADEVGAFYRGHGLARPVVAGASLPLAAELTNALVAQFDVDGSGTFDPAELDAIPALLTKLDRNDDELIGAGELLAGVRYPGVAGGTRLVPAGRETDGDSAEAAAFPVRVLRSSPDGSTVTRTTVRLSCTPGVQPIMETARDGASGTEGMRVRTGGPVVLRGDPGRLPDAVASLRADLLDAFAASGTDGDGVVDGVDPPGRPAGPRRGPDDVLRPLVPRIDRDGDRRITRAELEGWLDVQRQLAAGQVLLTVLHAGRGLFETLDTDHDGGLSLRELRQARTVLEASGATADGTIDPARLPEVVIVTVSAGYPTSPLGSTERVGPAWFLAMDRNADGTISRREFSEPPEVFDRLDADRDGLLTASEADAAQAE